MNTIDLKAVERWRLPRRVARLMSGALAVAMLPLGIGASPVIAAGEPDLAITVESLPTLANPQLVLKVTNISPDVPLGEAQTHVVFVGRAGVSAIGFPPPLGQVGGGGGRIAKLDPGKSTTFSVDLPAEHCSDIDPLGMTYGFPGALLRATASVTAVKSSAGVAETNVSNNVLEIPNPCEQYNVDISNARTPGPYPQVVIERRPDDAHPRELVLRVRNRGTEQVPPLALRVGLEIGLAGGPRSSPKNLREFSIPALAPDASVTESYDLRLPCYYDLYVTAILWNLEKNQKYEDDLEDTFICDNVKSNDAREDFDYALGFKLQVVTVRRPDAAHPRELLLAVRNIGTELSPPGGLGVSTRRDNGSDGVHLYPSLDPGESVTFSHQTDRPCPQHGGLPGDNVYLDASVLAYDGNVFDEFEHLNICD